MYINKCLINKYIVLGENGTIFLPFRVYHYSIFNGNITINLKKKRNFRRTYKAKSIFGDANQQVYDYIYFLKERISRDIDVLVVDANDGKNALPFARYGMNVVCYENDSILLNGGNYNGMMTQGLKKRVSDFKLKHRIVIKEDNYYEVKEINKFDFVYVENSLNLFRNSHINMKRKIKKLMASVREGGYLYIYYDIDENASNQSYLNYDEMKSYFDFNDWTIINICERNKSNYNHYEAIRKVGYVFAMKKRNRRKYKYHFTIEVNNKVSAP